MKKIILSLMCVAALGYNIAHAEGIAVVNVKNLIATSPQAKAINDNLKKRFADRKAKLEQRGNALQKRVVDFNKNRSVMSKDKQKETEASIAKDSQAFQQARVAYQQDLMKTENASMGAFIDKVKKSSAAVAKKKKLDVVLPANVAIYYKSTIDITPEVLKSLS